MAHCSVAVDPWLPNSAWRDYQASYSGMQGMDGMERWLKGETRGINM